jgi:leader peptidase (prepilin peptidase) / N-methyltransferase
MPRYQVLLLLLKAIWLFFIFAYGACVGSLINVIVYRMPLGLSIVSPPSRCPSCDTRLTWRENIPVFGWLLLRGKCRFCKSRISPEYPIVEASVGLLFCLFYIIWFILPDAPPHGPGAVFLGIDWSTIKPEWAMNDASKIWPTFVVLLVLLGSLVAMTIIDARTFMIPLELTWVPAIVGILAHPIHAAVVGLLRYRAPHEVWAITTPGPDGYGGVGAAFGAVLGLAISMGLLKAGLIRRSFADYPEWEKSLLAAEEAKAAPPQTSAAVSAESGSSPPIIEPGPVIQAALAVEPIAPASPQAGAPAENSPPGLAAVTLNAVPDSGPADLWVQYPHARREMLKELAFLAPAAALATLGWYLARWYGGVTYNEFLGMSVVKAGGAMLPLWVTVLGGALLGYLIGGGVVWGVRILGSLAFGKEAMGLGDVHLMAAVGACLGWIDSTLAFFGAAFVGLFWFILSSVFSKSLKRTMPYGPYLAVATLLVLLCKPLIELGLSRLTGQPVNIP